MIILRNKTYSFLDTLKNVFSSNKNQEDVLRIEKSSTSLMNKNIDFSEITFKEGYEKDYWPALVVIHIKSDEKEPYGGWVKFTEAMAKKGLFKKGGALTEIHPLSISDNVSGKNGASAVVLVFSKDTEISSSVRLAHRDYFKWPEDFFNLQNSFNTWYKSSKNINKIN